MALVQIQAAGSVFSVDTADPRLCKDFDLDCAHVLDYDFCALYDPEQGLCPFVGECDH